MNQTSSLTDRWKSTKHFVRTTEGDDDNDVSTILVDTEQLVSPVFDSSSSTTGYTDCSVLNSR